MKVFHSIDKAIVLKRTYYAAKQAYKNASINIIKAYTDYYNYTGDNHQKYIDAIDAATNAADIAANNYTIAAETIHNYYAGGDSAYVPKLFRMLDEMVLMPKNSI